MALASRVVHRSSPWPMLSLLSSILPFPFLLGAPPRRCLDTLWRHPLTDVTTRVYHPPSLPPSLPPESLDFFIFGSLGAIERSRHRARASSLIRNLSPPPSPSRVIYNPARKLFFIISSRNLGAMLGVRLVSYPALLFLFS